MTADRVAARPGGHEPIATPGFEPQGGGSRQFATG